MDISIDVPFDFEIRFEGEDGRPAEEVIEDIIGDYPSIRPARVVADCPYAVYVEFGTGPATQTTSKDHPTEFETRILEWVKGKLRITEEAEAQRVARRIYKRIVRYGLDPAPYLRPAIHDMMKSEVTEDWLDRGHTLEDIATGIVFRAKLNLERNDTDYTKELSNSIEVDRKNDLSIGPKEGQIEDYIWDSDELGYDGKKRPDFRRWSR